MAGEAIEAAGGQGPGGEVLPVFRGVTQQALDAKGRLAIPAKHRDALAMNGPGRLVLTADPSRCLLLYPLAGVYAWIKGGNPYWDNIFERQARELE